MEYYRGEEKPNNHSRNRKGNRRIESLSWDIFPSGSFKLETYYFAFLFIIHMHPRLLNLHHAVCLCKCFGLMTLAKHNFLNRGTK